MCRISKTLLSTHFFLGHTVTLHTKYAICCSHFVRCVCALISFHTHRKSYMWWRSSTHFIDSNTTNYYCYCCYYYLLYGIGFMSARLKVEMGLHACVRSFLFVMSLSSSRFLILDKLLIFYLRIFFWWRKNFVKLCILKLNSEFQKSKYVGKSNVIVSWHDMTATGTHFHIHNFSIYAWKMCTHVNGKSFWWGFSFVFTPLK